MIWFENHRVWVESIARFVDRKISHLEKTIWEDFSNSIKMNFIVNGSMEAIVNKLCFMGLISHG